MKNYNNSNNNSNKGRREAKKKANLGDSHGLLVAEVEAETLRLDEGALLVNVAEHRAERKVEDVCGSVVAHGGAAALLSQSKKNEGR